VTAKLRLTTAQALVRYLCAQYTEVDDQKHRLITGIFAIFGHGNVAGLGEALEDSTDVMPVFRAHNEQSMAHAAIAYAKASKRHRIMACTSSVGPGATNMVTAAAVAHVNRLPVLLLPGDTFANRRPDPVLQQIEDFSDPTVTANDCFRPVSRYWDRIMRPEQLLQTLPHAMSVLTDPVDCGPVTIALPQDIQTEVFEFPESFFDTQVHRIRRSGADLQSLAEAANLIMAAKRPLLIAGGGVHYSGAAQTLGDFATKFGIPVAETQAGKGSLSWDHPANVGSIGVTGSSAANQLAEDADLLIAVGTRLQDFTTGSGLLIRKPGCKLLSINVARHDLHKRGAVALQGDARRCISELSSAVTSGSIEPNWKARADKLRDEWNSVYESVTAATDAELPSDAQVLGAVSDVFSRNATVVCAAGGLPGELHKLWRSTDENNYHVEYGFSCMGYEIAGGMGVKMAMPDRDVVVMVGDGSYLMLNSEIATSIALRKKITIVVLDNRGFGCINRLQTSLGGKGFNNLLESSYDNSSSAPSIDFAQHAASLGASAEKVDGLAKLGPALQRAKECERTAVVVIDTNPLPSTVEGGTWWDVPVSASSDNEAVNVAYQEYLDKTSQRS
jgi:3D-(3,5/4)-trihydroxycyclohexane-1,2-dione acylhydrolase (decyclizing)